MGKKTSSDISGRQQAVSRQSPELKRQSALPGSIIRFCRTPNYQPAQKLVAYRISDGFNDRDFDGKSWEGCESIGDAIAMSKPTVIAMVRRLHARGHLRIKWGQQGKGHSNNYWMILKPQSAEVLETGKGQRADVLDDHEKVSGLNSKGQRAKSKGQPADMSHCNKPKQGSHTVRAAPPISASQPQQQHWQEGFAAFWQVYPKQVGKREAEREFKAALEHATAEEIIAGARRYAIDPVRVRQSQEDDRFTKNPNNWLRDGRWADKLAGVTIDEYGNPVAQSPPPQNGSDGLEALLARTLEMYPGNKWGSS